jgi:hypothetical protein
LIEEETAGVKMAEIEGWQSSNRFPERFELQPLLDTG